MKSFDLGPLAVDAGQRNTDRRGIRLSWVTKDGCRVGVSIGFVRWFLALHTGTRPKCHN